MAMENALQVQTRALLVQKATGIRSISPELSKLYGKTIEVRVAAQRLPNKARHDFARQFSANDEASIAFVAAISLRWLG